MLGISTAAFAGTAISSDTYYTVYGVRYYNYTQITTTSTSAKSTIYIDLHGKS